ncbi:MAG: YhcH/YjgK/YiaL family protein [bacterium]|nr:YhcH/YjgK/YiaL family protein [bacterium]
MLHGQYNEPHTYKAFLPHPVWETAFSWIQENANLLPDGEHAIQNRDVYANIQSVKTMPFNHAFYEVHEEYIDIHYCLSGGEIVAYAPIGNLVEKELNKDMDYQLFFPTANQSLCSLNVHSFAIFFPKELHMPKVQNGIHQEVRKVVIKIKASILGL